MYWSGVVGFITAKDFPGASLSLAGAALRLKQLTRGTTGQASSLARRRPAATRAPKFETAMFFYRTIFGVPPQSSV